jgi:2-keto-4-pentenoate hydratase/2-oxohepta-3-ene-1,7-dioic acid hydratase in catechol pathway
MKLVTFHTGDEHCRPGVLDAVGVIDLSANEPTLWPSVRGILAADALDRIREPANASSAIRAAGPILKSPITDPTKIIGIGLNYRDHAIESGMEIPAEPIVFAKFMSALIGPDEAIQLPPSSSQVDYEPELVVVIGKAAKNVSSAAAMRYVAGYSVATTSRRAIGS